MQLFWYWASKRGLICEIDQQTSDSPRVTYSRVESVYIGVRYALQPRRERLSSQLLSFAQRSNQ